MSDQDTDTIEERDASDIDPTELDIANHEDWTEAERQAYNQHVQEQLDEEIEEQAADEAEAISLLRQDAQQTLETETVTLEGEQRDFELEVRTRIPPSVEEMVEEFEELRQSGDIETARLLGCRIIANMIASPDQFTNPNVWIVASKDGSAGVQWLTEKAERILEPAQQRVGGGGQGNLPR